MRKSTASCPGVSGLISAVLIWGINWNLPANEEITNARLTIDDINNWFPEANDQLTMHLLAGANEGVSIFQDNQGGGDNIAALAGVAFRRKRILKH